MALTRFGFIVTGDDFELCGGFSPVWAGRIIEAIQYAVPVGVVAYGPESITGMARLFPR